MVGSLETKYKRSEYGLTFTEKWNTDNTLGTEIAIEDQVGKKLNIFYNGEYLTKMTFTLNMTVNPKCLAAFFLSS